MAKPRTPNQKKRYAELNKRLNRRVMSVNAYYEQMSMETARIVSTLTDYDPSSGKPFRFKDYPITKSSIDQLMRMFNLSTRGSIYSGVSEEWDKSNSVQDLMANDVLKAYGVSRNSDAAKEYYRKNQQEMKDFRRHKDKNGTVAQKVWNQTYNLKRELEYAISTAYEPGMGAAELGRKVSMYMHDFQRLRADYKRKFGKDVECQNCKWRTVRLVRSEANMAYRAAEQERWRQMDYVIGYEIKLSHKHPKPDMCDELVGIYPIWFKWLGWHALCMCYCIPITKTDDERNNLNFSLSELPFNLKIWMLNNKERLLRAKHRNTLPYWITDNEDTFDLLQTETRGEGTIVDTYVPTEEEKEYVFNELTKLNETLKLEGDKHLFREGTTFYFSKLDNNAFFKWDKNQVGVSLYVYEIDGVKFCPFEQLYNALKKLNSGQRLDLYEEYTIEGLYHESIHDRAIGIANITKIPQFKMLETCTQIIAREEYIAILEHYGVKSLYQDEIIENGIGYRNNCVLVRDFFSDASGNVDMDEIRKIADGLSDGLKAIVKKGKSKGIKTKVEASAWTRKLTL